VWVGVAFPTDLDAALTELKAAYPALAENIARLEHVAQQGALHFESEPGAGPDAFTAALRAWERACLDGLAALEHAQPLTPSQQRSLLDWIAPRPRCAP
jgi:hypothetical protein